MLAVTEALSPGRAPPDAGPNEAVIISFVVPAYNEAANLPGTVVEIDRAAAAAGVERYEIILVDDGSTDGTASVMAALAANARRVKHIANPRNLGLGGAYKNGVKHASGTYVMMIPGDNAHPADGIAPILRQAGAADIIIPHVVNPEARPWSRRIASRAFTRMLNVLFGLDVPYYNGLVLHRTALLRQIVIETDSFAYQAEAVTKLLKRGHSYGTIGVRIDEREHGGTKAFHPRNVVRVLKTVYDLKRRIA